MPSTRKRPTLDERLVALENVVGELISERDLGHVLTLVVREAMKLTQCDAGSIYLARNPKELEFLVALNDSVDFDFRSHVVPVSERGFASYCFRTGQVLNINDVYQLPKDSPYSFNDDFDKRTGYRTQSVLVHPLNSSKGERLGVLQLINPVDIEILTDPGGKPKTRKIPDEFTEEDLHFLTSFAAVAAATIENAKLYDSIQRLFDGFVRASVKAIESRDPPTGGHSDRVAILTVELAKSVSRSHDPAVRDIRFSRSEVEELRYASLLHDFGKIGVKEQTLLKANKLHPDQHQSIKHRVEGFSYIQEIQSLRQLLRTLRDEGRAPTDIDIAQLKSEIVGNHDQFKEIWELIQQLNKPTILDEEKQSQLDALRIRVFPDYHGKKIQLLSEEEIAVLSITRGSLTQQERKEIEAHVTQTYLFLKEIPWSREFQTLPEIAYAHHEKLDGSGYPRGLKAKQIPIQSQLMTICDIFDALVAADRPYKRALPNEKAVSILEDMAKRKQLNADALRVFIEAKLFDNVDFRRLIPKQSAA